MSVFTFNRVDNVLSQQLIDLPRDLSLQCFGDAIPVWSPRCRTFFKFYAMLVDFRYLCLSVKQLSVLLKHCRYLLSLGRG